MSLPNAITREDFYLNKIANPSDDHELPDAITRHQHYLKAIAENAGGVDSKPFIYSTDERVVGTWIDGKPLYQRTFVRNDITTRSDFYLVDDSTINIHNVRGQFIDPWGSCFDLVAYYDSENYRTYSFITNHRTQVRSYCSFGSTVYTNVGAEYTIQYTKIADAPTV